MNPALDQLPVSITPVTGEAVDSYLERLSAANDITTAHLTTRLGLREVTPVQLRHSPPLTADPSTVCQLRIAEKQPPGVRNGWDPGAITQACPPCLAGPGAWLTNWYDPMVTICLTHHVLLATGCPGCGQPLRNQRAPLRTVTGTVCGNPLGAGRGPRCDADLADLPAVSADRDVMTQQLSYQNQGSTEEGSGLRLLGTFVTGQQYRTELIALAVLLLHVNDTTQPADNGATRRWFLSPPTSTAIRAAVLAEAHRILTSPTGPAAAKEFAAHFAQIPTTWEGPVTWAFDHTTPTDHVARIIRIASGTRTRLSYQLDHHDSLPTLASSRIPQVAPHRHRDLLGESGLSANTAASFATLCLARAAPTVTTWAAAAETLGLASDYGVDLAHAATTRLTCGPAAWITRLAHLADALLLDDIDYRTRERAVRSIAAESGNLIRALQKVRPGTRTSSAPFAVCALWETGAGGHLYTSPAHSSLAGRQHKANYRQFRKSLRPEHLAALQRLADQRSAVSQGKGSA